MEMFEFRARSVKNRASKYHYKICNKGWIGSKLFSDSG